MDYFQGVVAEYLRADRGMFINTECLLQLDSGRVPAKGRHWYCDLLAVSMRERRVYLCEVTYSQTLAALLARLRAWSENWDALKKGLHRDCGIDPTWSVQAWAFVPQERAKTLQEKLDVYVKHGTMPQPRITHLESVTPWRYCTWDRTDYPDETEPWQTIVGVRGEGGSVTLRGQRSPLGWTFELATSDHSAVDLGDPESQTQTAVGGWGEALLLLESRPWKELYPAEVHSDFAHSVFQEIDRRSGERPLRYFEEWKELCRAGQQADSIGHEWTEAQRSLHLPRR